MKINHEFKVLLADSIAQRIMNTNNDNEWVTHRVKEAEELIKSVIAEIMIKKVITLL